MSARKVTASAAQVRAWATENGLTVGTRGKLSPEAIKGYNDVHRVKYVQAGHVPTVQVTGKRTNAAGAQRKVTVTATNAEIRAFAVEAGLAQPGSRGRFSAETLARFVANG